MELTKVQTDVLSQITDRWKDVDEFGYKYHAIGNTLKALEKRKLIEIREDDLMGGRSVRILSFSF